MAQLANLSPGFTTTVTSGTAITMTSASTVIQVLTGSTAQTVKLPTTGIAAGATYTIINKSSAIATVQSSAANTIESVGVGNSGIYIAVVATPTTAANWVTQYNAGPAAPSTTVTALTTVETVIVAIPLPAGLCRVGTTFRLDMNYHPAATTVETVRIRIGTSATVPATDTCVLALADVTSTAGRTVSFIGGITVIGPTATFIGNFRSSTDVAVPVWTGSALTTNATTFNSTVDNFLMVTVQNTTSTTTTVYGCVLEIIN